MSCSAVFPSTGVKRSPTRSVAAFRQASHSFLVYKSLRLLMTILQKYVGTSRLSSVRDGLRQAVVECWNAVWRNSRHRAAEALATAKKAAMDVYLNGRFWSALTP